MCDFNSSEEKFVSDHSNIAVIPCILKFPGLLLVRYRICPPGPLVTLRSNQILIPSGNSQSRGCVYVFDPVVGLNAGKLFSDMPGVDGVNDQYGVFNGSQTTLVVSQRRIRSGMPILSVADHCLRNRKFSMDCHDTVFLLLHREKARKKT